MQLSEIVDKSNLFSLFYSLFLNIKFYSTNWVSTKNVLKSLSEMNFYQNQLQEGVPRTKKELKSYTGTQLNALLFYKFCPNSKGFGHFLKLESVHLFYR